MKREMNREQRERYKKIIDESRKTPEGRLLADLAGLIESYKVEGLITPAGIIAALETTKWMIIKEIGDLAKEVFE